MDPQNLKCAQVGAAKYRLLCQVTSLPVQNDTPDPAFTGQPDTDIMILSRFSDRELLDICAVNKYVNKLCNKDNFWANRTIERYGSVLGSGSEIKKYIPEGTSWKEYYLWLSGLVEGNIDIATSIAIAHDRQDLKLLLNISPVTDNFGTFYVRNAMLGFLREADFGPSDLTNKWSIPLRDFISTIETRVADRVILSRLFEIYIRYNGLVKDQSTIKISPLMKKWFNLESDESKWYIVQNLITSAVDQRMVNAEQLKFMNSPEVLSRLAAENELYNSIAVAYR